MTPVADRRDGYRAEVDRAVSEFGAARVWSAAQLRKARRICYRTVWAECDWRNYANRKVPISINILPNDGYPDHGGDALSVGLYQQMEKWGWGDPAGSMDPFTATTRFLQGMLRNAPGWFGMAEASVCQETQQSQFDGKRINPATGKPYPYAQNYIDRETQTNLVDENSNYFARVLGRS